LQNDSEVTVYNLHLSATAYRKIRKGGFSQVEGAAPESIVAYINGRSEIQALAPHETASVVVGGEVGYFVLEPATYSKTPSSPATETAKIIDVMDPDANFDRAGG
jgi:hypothetical protein